MQAKSMIRIAVFWLITLGAATAMAGTPKYVFFFIGDGMSSAQIQATEAYLTVRNGGSATRATDLQKPENRLNLTRLPVLGMQTTASAHALITDSAAAATAFACGVKTTSGVIGMDATTTISYKSIAQLAAEQGRRIGIVSTVALDHATPAGFYASVASRGDLNAIARQMAATGYDFFGGGGLAATEAVRIKETLVSNGYTLLNDRHSILGLQKAPRAKVFCLNSILQDGAAMPYAIDQPAANLTLAEMTAVAIDSLLTRKKDERPGGWFNRDQGFFLMVEGGKIDWACHANDARTAIGDLLDFDDAVGKALAFYHKYPSQTLIVVTGDHETGGMSVGQATTGSSAYYQRLLGQTMSHAAFALSPEWQAIKSHYDPKKEGSIIYVNTDNNLASDPAMLDLIHKAFGLKWEEDAQSCKADSKKICLNRFQKQKLEAAFDKSIAGYDKNDPENKLLYGDHEPIAITLTHILNEVAGIGWTSYTHTGVPVPVFAIGPESTRFAGFYDNTDIAKQMARSMGIWQPLPVVKTAAGQ